MYEKGKHKALKMPKKITTEAGNYSWQDEAKKEAENSNSGDDSPDGLAKNSIPDAETLDGDIRQRQVLRDILIEKVRLGEITPANAKLRASKGKLEPLLRSPGNLDYFDSSVVFWSVGMTVSWIQNRHPKAVHRHYKHSYEGVSVWKKNALEYLIKADATNFKWAQADWPAKQKVRTRTGYDLRFLADPSRSESYLDFDGEELHFPNIKNFHYDLRPHLCAGRITANGLPAALYSTQCEIPPALWVNAHMRVSDDDNATLELGGKEIYKRVRFNAEQVVKAYPPAKDFASKPTRIYLWKNSAKQLTGYKAHIVKSLKDVYFAGFPVFQSEKIRDFEIKNILSRHDIVRWYPTDNLASVELMKANDAFRIAMTRLLNQVLGDVVIK